MIRELRLTIVDWLLSAALSAAPKDEMGVSLAQAFKRYWEYSIEDLLKGKP